MIRIFMVAFVMFSCASVVMGANKKAAKETLKDPKGWFLESADDKAVAEARELGRPLAIMVHDPKSDCPLHNGQRAKWKVMAEFKDFVCVLVEQSTKSETIQQIRSQASGKTGKFIPYVLLANPDGTLLDVVKYETDKAATAKILKDALKKYGDIPSEKTAKAMWKDLEKARDNMKDGKLDSAMRYYRGLKSKEKKYGHIYLFSELKNDEPAIAEAREKALAEVKKLEDAGDAKAASEARKVDSLFKGFESEAEKEAGDKAKK
ncbi:MAG: hypothetical protein JXR97_16805 [Planctomycetes bacterium]|nr:hypothetical protein [Planctomycetota bacterium]